MIVGTPYFVSRDAAIKYYRGYGFDNVGAAVERKIQEKEIYIGKPPTKSGDSLLLVDDGTRYAIDEAKSEKVKCEGVSPHMRGALKLYPTGGGGNLILCGACWKRENHYRKERGAESGCPENWPTPSWDDAEIYAA